MMKPSACEISIVDLIPAMGDKDCGWQPQLVALIKSEGRDPAGQDHHPVNVIPSQQVMAYLEGRHLHLSTVWLLEHFLKPLGGFHHAALPIYTHYHPNDSRLLSLLQSSRKWERCMPMGS